MTRAVLPAEDLIRRTRVQRGYSQYQFASRLASASGNTSLTREEVARWERGKRIPGPYWRGWISRMLQLELSELEAAAKAAREARRAEQRQGAGVGRPHADGSEVRRNAAHGSSLSVTDAECRLS